MKKLGLIFASCLMLLGGLAYADVNYTQGAGTVIFDFTCFVSKHCPAHVPTNSAGTEIFTSAVPGQVTGANGTFPATQSGTWTVQPGNTANSTAWLVTGTGGTFPATQSGTWGTRITGNAGGVIDAIGQNATAPANWWQIGCQFQTSPTTITAGNGSPLQCNNGGKLLTSDTVAQASLASIDTKASLPLPTQAITVPIGGVGVIDSNSKTALLDPCQYTTHVWTRIDVAAAASTVLVAGTSAKKTYICSIGLMAAGTTNLGIVEGSGSTCGTSPLGLIGGNTAAKGLNLTAQAGVSFGNGEFAIAASTVNANDVCLINSLAIQVSGFIVTATP